MTGSKPTDPRERFFRRITVAADPCTLGENSRRSPNYNGTKTHCRNGHPLSGENLVIRSDGWRRCRTCDRAKYTRRKARAEESAA